RRLRAALTQAPRRNKGTRNPQARGRVSSLQRDGLLPQLDRAFEVALRHLQLGLLRQHAGGSRPSLPPDSSSRCCASLLRPARTRASRSACTACTFSASMATARVSASIAGG